MPILEKSGITLDKTILVVKWFIFLMFLVYFLGQFSNGIWWPDIKSPKSGPNIQFLKCQVFLSPPMENCLRKLMFQSQIFEKN